MSKSKEPISRSISDFFHGAIQNIYLLTCLPKKNESPQKLSSQDNKSNVNKSANKNRKISESFQLIMERDDVWWRHHTVSQAVHSRSGNWKGAKAYAPITAFSSIGQMGHVWWPLPRQQSVPVWFVAERLLFRYFCHLSSLPNTVTLL